MDLAGRLALLGGAAVAMLLVLALVTSAFLPPVFRGLGAMANLDVAIPDEVSLSALSERSVVYAADGSVLAVLHDEVDRRIVPLEDIPGHVRDAVIAAEDQKFWHHNGYDIEGILRAAISNVRAGGVQQGGSTITQQLAKGLVGSDRTLERKLNELTHAVALEQRYTKEELLERYLNAVYLGNGAYGVAAAAEEYFHRQVGELSPSQGALLAALIRSPARLDPRRDPERATMRRDAVLRAMAAAGALDQAQLEEALAEPLGVKPHQPRPVREPFVIEAVKREFFANPAFGDSREERIRSLFSGGLQIDTTLDPELQRAADEVVREFFPTAGGPTAALAALDPRDGRVLAVSSGLRFDEEQYDLTSQGRRQPGSAFKPFVLAAALDLGFSERMRLTGNGPVEFPIPGSKPWKVDNYGRSDHGQVGLREALVRSVNTAFAQLVMVLGPEAAAATAERLGIDMRAAMAGQPPVPAIALGGLGRGVTPLEMASAFGVFAAGGQRAQPHLIARVRNRAGDVLWEADATPQVVIEPAVAGAMVDIMRDVVTSGTGRRARLPGWQAMGKTGTTQNSADAWFIGAVPVLSAAIWMGHPDAQVPMRGMTGGSVPARMWQRFMTRALVGVQPVPWPQPPPLSAARPGGRTQIPDVVGWDATDALRRLAEARLVGIVRLVHTTRSKGKVMWQSPRAGRTVDAGEEVVLGVSSGRAARRQVAPATATPTPAPSPSTASPSPTPAPPPSPEPPAPRRPPEPTVEPTAEPSTDASAGGTAPPEEPGEPAQASPEG